MLTEPTVIYEDQFCKIYDGEDGAKYKRVKVKVGGEVSHLLDFTVILSSTRRRMLAYKFREDKKLILYFCFQYGGTYLKTFKKTISEKYPDYQLQDARLQLRHHAQLEKNFEKAEKLTGVSK